MVKDKSGMDNVLSSSDFKNNGLIEKYSPMPQFSEELIVGDDGWFIKIN
tara:strand:+ start:474 stop:620 length:147 start_codon:yes stop_codon:yes gene_type:complete